MRTSDKITFIAGLSAIALIGTGYAAWVFSEDSTITGTGNVSIITKGQETGSLNQLPGQENLVLTLDQDFIGWQTQAKDNNTSDISSLTLEYQGSQAKDTRGEYAVDEDIVVTMSADYGVLSTYVQFGDLQDVELVKEFTGEAITFEFRLPTVSYVDSMYPRNEKAYDEMVEAFRWHQESPRSAALENQRIASEGFLSTPTPSR